MINIVIYIYIMVNILIHGFPHCGTSILKSIIGHIDQIYEYPYAIDIILCF